MALLTFLSETKEAKTTPSSKRMKKQQKQKKQNEPSSWGQVKNILSCNQMEGSKVIDPSKNTPQHHGNSKLGASCSSICRFRDVVNGNTRVAHRADNSPESSSLGQETTLLSRKAVSGSSSSRSLSARSSGGGGGGSGGSGGSHTSSRAMQFRKLSGCYECHMIVDPSRYLAPRTTICACSLCGELFSKIESLELHQAVRHAVSELGPEDSGRNIVEIIFKSSWLKKDNPICKIERILKVHNSQCTIQLFEDCRDAVKTRGLNSTKKHARCAADGNELLRFYCTTLSCSLGSKGSSSLCGSIPGCGVCTIIRHGFQGKCGGASTPAGFKGVRTTASSGRAHDSLMKRTDERRAMIVCRVIAGRVKRVADDAPTEEENVVSAGPYDSVAAYTNAGVYSNLEELIVFNPRAILPCFVVIYKALES